ncbi:hypothetical protein WJ968_04385 [Achromobacter xylosoxidans]
MLHVIVTTAHANEGLFPTYPQGTTWTCWRPATSSSTGMPAASRDATPMSTSTCCATARSRRTTTRPNWTWRRAITWRCWASRAPGCMRAMRRVAAADGFHEKTRTVTA